MTSDDHAWFPICSYPTKLNSKRQEWQNALKIFDEFSTSLPLDVVAYNAAISACEKGQSPTCENTGAFHDCFARQSMATKPVFAGVHSCSAA